jgi:hypothetical protein
MFLINENSSIFACAIGWTGMPEIILTLFYFGKNKSHQKGDYYS